ncbi:MAG: ribosome maturation factor RimM [Treponema sp.]|jgi:16S rRNA processing protein RimM|nr:ribosome maturation factor RimM [Treponema sp.]
MDAVQKFVAGIVGPPFGLKGFVKIRSLSGEWEYLFRFEEVLLRRNGRERIYQIEAKIPSASSLALKFKGIDTPEAVKALTGAELLVDRADAAPLREGEFYVEDLRGMEVTAERPEGPLVLGHITDVVEGGGGDLVEVRLNSGKLQFIPFRKEFFGTIDSESRRAALLAEWILDELPPETHGDGKP